MNLNVKFRHVQQENYMQMDGDNFKDAINEEKGRKFQKVAIHFVFYEMIPKSPPLTGLIPTVDEQPQLSSMTWCKLKKNLLPDLPQKTFESDLLLVLKGVTAQFVTKEQYHQLLFILGQNLN